MSNVRGKQWQIIATFFKCTAENGDVTLGEDHDSFEWIESAKYKEYDLIGNLHPAFEAFMEK